MKKYYSVIAVLFVLSLFFGSCTNKKTNRPNIIFIMSDDHAFQAISAYQSNLIKTPNIDRIAEQGIVFNKAFVTNSLCAPSRAVILSGRFSHLNGVKGNTEAFNGNQQTFPKLLQKNGYQTAIVGKWHLKSNPTGFDYWNILPGQGDYYNPDFIKQGLDTIYKGYVTNIITELSINWLKNRKKDKPFCLMIQHKAPHRNWMPALKNLSLFDEKEFPLPANFYDDYKGRKALQRQLLTVKDHMDIRMDFKIPCTNCDTVPVNWWAPETYLIRMSRLTAKEKNTWDNSYKKEETEFYKVKNDTAKYDRWKYRRFLEDYLRCIVSVDESVGQVLDFLKQNKLDENTIVIYTSDQGFFLGEHGLFDKRFMYEEAMRTPLLMRFPKEISPNLKSEQLVQNLDIAPTLLDVAGIEIPKEMQGKSMRPIWQNPESKWRDEIYYHYYEKGFGATPHYGIRTKRFKLIHFYDEIDSWELYDLKKDPSEMNNLIDVQNFQEQVSKLKKKLKELRVKYDDN